VKGAVGSSTVAVANVLREHNTQVPLAEDQHTVDEFGSKGAYEPFGDTVARGQQGGILTTRMPVVQAATSITALSVRLAGHPV
jgi:hypothetical protein